MSDEELGGSYDRAVFFEQRYAMAQAWADLRDDLEAGREASPFRMNSVSALRCRVHRCHRTAPQLAAARYRTVWRSIDPPLHGLPAQP